MTQEDKQLLLKDLSARLPYGVKCTTKSSWNGIYTIEGYKDNRVFLDCPVYDEGDDEWMIESIVPYLRPMSSMTEEEKIKLYQIAGFYYLSNNELLKNEWIQFSGALSENKLFLPYPIWEADLNKAYDWLNAHHFDYRNLINKGLAIEVNENNNPYKCN